MDLSYLQYDAALPGKRHVLQCVCLSLIALTQRRSSTTCTTTCAK